MLTAAKGQVQLFRQSEANGIELPLPGRSPATTGKSPMSAKADKGILSGGGCLSRLNAAL
ncbi:MAG: hypothetical protein ACI9NG_001445 [Hyphomonas sp.]|jgi:hypothetical protein